MVFDNESQNSANEENNLNFLACVPCCKSIDPVNRVVTTT